MDEYEEKTLSFVKELMQATLEFDGDYNELESVSGFLLAAAFVSKQTNPFLTPEKYAIICQGAMEVVREMFAECPEAEDILFEMFQKRFGEDDETDMGV